MTTITIPATSIFADDMRPAYAGHDHLLGLHCKLRDLAASEILGSEMVSAHRESIDAILTMAHQDGEGAAAAAICEHYATIKAEVADLIEAGDL